MSEIIGCGNHACIIKKPVGMGTNGPCDCLFHPDSAKRISIYLVIQRLRSQLKTAEKVISDLQGREEMDNE